MKKIVFSLVLIALLLVPASYLLRPGSENGNANVLETKAVELGAIEERINTTGIVQPREVVAVSSALGGEVAKIFPEAEFNRTIVKGQPLVQLDDRAAALKLAHAQITVELAKTELEATKEGVAVATKILEAEKTLNTRDKVNAATAQLALADARLKLAEVKVREAEEGVKAAQLGLDMATIRAPMSGVIIDRKVTLGQMVGPQLPAPLFLIATDMRQVQVLAQINDGDLGKVIPGMRAECSQYLSAAETFKFEGEVRAVRLPATNIQGVVFYTAVIDVENQKNPRAPGQDGWILRPGMTVSIDIVGRKHANAWLVDNAALFSFLDDGYLTPAARDKLQNWQPSAGSRDDWQFVYILKDNKPWPVFARVGGSNAQGEPGFKNERVTEILEWEPELQAELSKGPQPTLPRVIVNAPPFKKPSLLERLNIKTL